MGKRGKRTVAEQRAITKGSIQANLASIRRLSQEAAEIAEKLTHLSQEAAEIAEKLTRIKGDLAIAVERVEDDLSWMEKSDEELREDLVDFGYDVEVQIPDAP